MLFSSITFLYVFLPFVVILYFISMAISKKFNMDASLMNVVLLLASILFYAWGEPRFVLVMLLQTIIGYIFARLIDRNKDKRLLIISVAINLLCLGYFKYADFFIDSFNKVTGLSISLLKIALPIGISFYTFQILSYVADVYLGRVAAQKNIIFFMTYVSMFPQLIAGPIVRYKDIEKDIADRKFDIEEVANGVICFSVGLAKKVLIANSLGELVSVYKASSDLSVLFFWMYAVASMLQIYFDFSGYSDMAIGLGTIFGFSFPQNFNYPYVSKSITEFWRRWHITLGGWFRDYVYIPLGGNRVSKIKWVRNILVVWMLTGFWHGASWNFVIWGLFYGVILLFEKLLSNQKSESFNILKHAYVLIVVMLGFIIFDSESMSLAVRSFRGLLGLLNIPLVSNESLYYLKSFSLVFIAGIVGCTPLPKLLVSKIPVTVKRCLSVIFVLTVFIIVTAYLIDGSFNPFLYFRF